MERRHAVDHPINDLLARRWSPRAFAPRSVDRATLMSLLEAARWAPSSSNEQPWSYIVAAKEEPEQFAAMLACLVEKNQQWARHAPVLMLAVAAKNFARAGKPNNHAWYDTGAATASLLIEATSRGLFAHEMAGFDPAKARTTYAIPAEYDAISGIALGYLGDPNSLPEDFRQRELTPSTRKPISDFVYAGAFGKPAEWVKK